MPATPPIRHYREQATRTVNTWTPTQMRAAVNAADAGHLMRLADLVDSIMEDDRVAGTVGTRTRGLLRLPLSFATPNPEGTEPKPDQARAALGLEDDFWRMFPEAQLGELMTWGHLLGVGIGEMRWSKRGERLTASPRVWHPRWLRYDQEAESWHLTTANAGEIPIEPDDPSWFLFTPYGADRPWRRAAVRPLAAWWLLKRYAIQDWGTYGEAHGNPTRVGTAPPTASKADRDSVAADLQDIAGRSGMMLPDGFTVELIEATARTWETFDAQIKVANAGIAVIILGQTLTTEVSGGSLAAAQVHDTVRNDIIEADSEILETSLHDGPITHWARFNYGLEEHDAPWARWDTTPRSQREIFEYHLKAGVITKNELREYLGLEPFDGEEGAELINITEGEAQQLRALTNRPTAPAVERIRLASGDKPSSARAYVRGQLYVSGLAQRLDSLAPLKASFKALSEMIENASSYQDVEEQLPKLLEELDPDDTGPLMEALMLADLAGQKAASDEL